MRAARAPLTAARWLLSGFPLLTLSAEADATSEMRSRGQGGKGWTRGERNCTDLVRVAGRLGSEAGLVSLVYLRAAPAHLGGGGGRSGCFAGWVSSGSSESWQSSAAQRSSRASRSSAPRGRRRPGKVRKTGATARASSEGLWGFQPAAGEGGEPAGLGLRRGRNFLHLQTKY